MRVRLLLLAATCLTGALGVESLETMPVRPGGSEYVPPPYSAVETGPGQAAVLGRRYDLSGFVPDPRVGERKLLQNAELRLNGVPVAPPAGQWVLRTPAVSALERSWNQAGLPLKLRQTVEYDGFITCELTIGPGTVESMALNLAYQPDASTLYHIPVFTPTYAEEWPARFEVPQRIVSVWGGDDHAGFTTYFGTQRHWTGEMPKVVLTRGDDGLGRVEARLVQTPVNLTAPTTFRFGFIATPVRPPVTDHLRLYASATGRAEPEELTDRLLIWAALSDHYATFSTNDPAKDEAKKAMVKAIHDLGKACLAYTTYMHVEEGSTDEVPLEWAMIDGEGKPFSRSIGGAAADINRVFIATGNPAWVDWKIKDLEHAIETYGVDGFYIDTSYIIMPMYNESIGMGWRDAAGETQPDYPIWSMRELWRRSYELLCQKKGEAHIYAHHKGGCPAALAAFTSAFCDGEQFTGQSIRNLTPAAMRAQVSGRPMGVRGHLIEQYFRSANYSARERSQHHNPTESAMLALLHDILPTGYPGNHPLREVIQLSRDLELTEAVWTPYYEGQTWRIEGAPELLISSYLNARGEQLLVVGNPSYEDQTGRLTGGRETGTLVAIDVLSRIGRSAPETPGYRWEPSDGQVAVPARSFRIYGWVAEPTQRAAFKDQQGLVASLEVARTKPVPEGALVLSSFDDPDLVLVNDDGDWAMTEDQPVDTRGALRVSPKPQHNAAAILFNLQTPADWSEYGSLSLWVRPTQPLKVAAFDLKLRNNHQYGNSLTLVSHDKQAVLPAGEWTQLRYAFKDVARDLVMILRVYHHRGSLNSGPFDLDELLLLPGDGTETETERQRFDEGGVPD